MRRVTREDASEQVAGDHRHEEQPAGGLHARSVGGSSPRPVNRR
jgi:hypothetical protein